MPLLCISPSLNAQTPVYPGDTPFSVTWEAGDKDDFTLSTFSMSPHVGAHMDAPKHRAGSLPDITEIPLDTGVGPAWVCDVSAGTGAIDSDAFLSVPKINFFRKAAPETGYALYIVLTGRANKKFSRLCHFDRA